MEFFIGAFKSKKLYHDYSALLSHLIIGKFMNSAIIEGVIGKLVIISGG